MSLEWEQLVLDARDTVTLGRWWQSALRWVIVNDDPDEFEIRPAEDRLPGIVFEPVREASAPRTGSISTSGRMISGLR